MNPCQTKDVLRAVLVTLLVAGCDRVPPTTPEKGSDTAMIPPVAASSEVSNDWQLDVSPRGGARLLYPAGSVDGETPPILVLTCLGNGRLIVRLPRVVPIGSEERLSLGDGNQVFTMVAETHGVADAGVAARGSMPEQLETMLADGILAAYGTASVGELPPVPAIPRARFLAACNSGSSPDPSGNSALAG